MPLPHLCPSRVTAANAVALAKRVLLGDEPARAAHELGTPVDAARDNPDARALVRATVGDEAEMLRASDNREAARAALDSREGRAAWLAGVVSGEIKAEGAFGLAKQFPPQSRLAAMKLLGQMYGDYVIRHEVQVEERAVVVFRIPDNGRVPESVVECPSEP